MTNMEKYLKTYEGEKIRFRLHEEGIWEVRGEDPNCDLGGAHIEPSLGFFQGKLMDVVAKAVEMDRFWQWGSGGSIRKIEVVQLK
jgi:hypothetical protein